MPTLTNTIQEYSPLLQYRGAWLTGTGRTDSFISSYSAVSFVSTQVAGASVSFSFNGTGVQIFGAKRGNHGLYTVNVDGTDLETDTGSITPDQFQVSLFSTNSLQAGHHTVTITNQENKFLDIDYVTWQNSIGKSNEDLIVNTVDDTSSDFQYSPASAWSGNPTNAGTFLGGTGHETSSPDASLIYTFNVSNTLVYIASNIVPGVALYGPIGPNYSPFSVQVDGGAAQDYLANNDNFLPQTMLFYAGGLGPGKHTLKLNYKPSQAGQIFAVDYATTSTTSSLGGAPLTLASSASSHGLSGGQVAGVVIGLLLCLALVFCGLYYFIIRPRRKRPSYNGSMLESSLAGQDGYSAGYIAQPGRAYSMRQPSRPVSVSLPGQNAVPPLLDIPSVAPSSAYSSGDDPYSLTSYTSNANHIRSSGSVSSNSTSPRGGSAAFRTKSQRTALPASAGQSLDQIPSEQLAASRMVVEGRPQDFGSVNPNSYSVGDRRETIPPPNYMQATEAY